MFLPASLLGVSAGNYQKALVDKSEMIRNSPFTCYPFIDAIQSELLRKRR
jgi:hypothetical protein